MKNQKNLQEELKFEKYKIYNYLIDYKKRFYKKDSEVCWPVNLSKGGECYYPTNKLDSLTNPNTNIIHYYYNNHNLNTNDKKNYIKKHKYNGKIDFYSKKTNFFQFINITLNAF